MELAEQPGPVAELSLTLEHCQTSSFRGCSILILGRTWSSNLFFTLEGIPNKLQTTVLQEMLMRWKGPWVLKGFIFHTLMQKYLTNTPKLIATWDENIKKVKLLVVQFETPWIVLSRLLCPWDSSSKNTRVGCHSLH